MKSASAVGHRGEQGEQRPRIAQVTATPGRPRRRPPARAGGELDQDAEARRPCSAALVDGQARRAPTRRRSASVDAERRSRQEPDHRDHEEADDRRAAPPTTSVRGRDAGGLEPAARARRTSRPCRPRPGPPRRPRRPPTRSAPPLAERPDQDRAERRARSRAGPAPGSRPARPTRPGRRSEHDAGSRGAAFHTAGTTAAGCRQAPDRRSGAVGRSWGAGRVSARRRARRRGVGELVGLVDHVGGDLAELVAVLAGVVGAEEQLAAGLELDPQVGLGSATVAAVRGAQRAELGATAVVTSASFLIVRCRGST